MNRNSKFKKLLLKTAALALTLSFGIETACYGLATLPASQNPIAKREIIAALQRTQIRYAGSEDALRLLNANDAECLLLSSGKYLVGKEVAQDDIKLLRGIVHEDIEAIMQILTKENRYKYQGIKELILKYFPPTRDNLAKYYPIKKHDSFSLDLYVNHIVAAAFEWLCLVSEGIIIREEIPESNREFIDTIEPIIKAHKHNYFTEEFWNSIIRGKTIRIALNNGMRFYQTSSTKFNAGEQAKIRTYADYLSDSLHRQPDKIGEIELFAFWPLYLYEVDRFFAEAIDYQKAYNAFYHAYFEHMQEREALPDSVKAYIPIVRKPFLNIKEVKDLVGISCEWSIDFLPTPVKWKGVQLFSFVLCLMDDGQLHMSFFDGHGVAKELSTDGEVDTALRETGLIGDDGMLILVRSSMDQNLRDFAVSGLAGRIALSGHSHPKGSGIKPSRSGDWDSPADIELFTLRFFGLPKEFPINHDAQILAERKQEVSEEERSGVNAATKNQAETPNENPDIPDKNLAGALEQCISKLEGLANSEVGQTSRMPINELVLYLKVLRAMYKATIGKYQGTGYDYEYVHECRAEFAGELAYHPKFQAMASRMLRESYEGAFRVLAEQNPGSFIDNPSSLDEMLSIMSRLIKEYSMHPELRDAAIDVINDPKTYGLDEIDLIRTDSGKGRPAIEGIEAETQNRPQSGIKGLIGAVARKVTGKISITDKKEAPSNEAADNVQQKQLAPLDDDRAISTVTNNAIDFAAVSDRLIAAAEKGKSQPSNVLRLRPEEVVRERARRLLNLADACANDNPQLAETTLREYSRLLKTFGGKVDFYCAVNLDSSHKNIMTNRSLKPILMEVASSIPDRDDRLNVLTNIAGQLIKEGNRQGALDLLEEVRSATHYYVFFGALKQLIDLLLSAKEHDQKMIKQLERIIENIPASNGRTDERKVELLAILGNKYYQLGMAGIAGSFYEKAWAASERAEQPAVTRLEYLVPVMREKNMQFPISRRDVLMEVRRIAESDLRRNYPNEKPDKMILLAREYAFNREYDKAEECARLINENMEFPRDHFDHCYGAIIEAAALYGDSEKITYAASKMTNYVKDHFECAAQILVRRGEYQKAMELGNKGMGQGYVGSTTVGYWGSTQLRIAKNILRQDNSQIKMVREYIEGAIADGIGSIDLEDMVNLLSEYPALDPDGQFILKIFNTAFERNLSFVTHDSHRIILQNLRKIIFEKAGKVDSSLLGIPDVYARADRLLENGLRKALPPAAENTTPPAALSRGQIDELKTSRALDLYDIQPTTVLWLDLLYAELHEDRVYEIKYDVSRLSPSQVEIIEEYVRLLQKRSSNPNSIKPKPFSSAQGSKESLIAVYCTGKDFKGEGHVDVAIPDGELKDYLLRITGMVNIALASSNIPDNLSMEEVDKYRPIMGYIKNQYKSILGEELAIPDNPEDILKVIRRIVLGLPKSMRMKLDQIEEYNRLAKEALTAA